MNQKDYKKIAKILARNYNRYPSDTLISDLADYFEKEVKERWEETNKNNLKKGIFLSGKGWLKDNDFNKRQFLKDCGIEK